MRGSRRYTKRIEVWQTTSARTSGGGSTIQEYKLTDSWANVSTYSADKNKGLTEIGISDPSLAIKVVCRKREDITYNSINQFVVYAGIKYKIVTEPTDLNFTHAEVEFMAVRTKEKVSQIQPLEFYQINVENRVVYDGGTIENKECLTKDINKQEDGL
jgi:hypothetical protein